MRRKNGKGKVVKMKYVLAKSSPWVVQIDGHLYVVSSAVARLLLQLADEKENKRE